MARSAGVDLPKEKRVEIGLTYISVSYTHLDVYKRQQHPLYKKIMKRTVKFKAHDEKNECGVGDRCV